MDLPSVLEPDDVTAMLRACDSRKWIGRRDRVLLMLMVRCGLRVSEACSLQRDQCIRLENGYRLKLRNVKRTVGKGAGKKGRFRNVMTPPDLTAALDAWLTNDLPTDAAFILASQKGERLSRSAAWRRVSGIAARIGISHPVWPHMLRHTAITEMLEEGLELHEAKMIAGHSSIVVTDLYTHVRNHRVESKMTSWERG